MQGISPRLPLNVDADGGYISLQTLREVAAQNLKMITLTDPGERVMDPVFGAGVRSLLFENQGPNVDIVRQRIKSQAAIYLPWVSISQIQLSNSDNLLSIIIYYTIPNLGTGLEVLSITVN
tara:strand:+ start:474 stop:836 length:363 start_codon:yes stop_codon:yes gene_type:complete